MRSTTVPSLPVPSVPHPCNPGGGVPARTGTVLACPWRNFTGKAGAPGTLEGWRAVLIVMLRYGMAHKQRIEYSFLAPKDPISDVAENGDEMEVDSVKAMVAGVKTRGVCHAFYDQVCNYLHNISTGKGPAQICPRSIRLVVPTCIFCTLRGC